MNPIKDFGKGFYTLLFIAPLFWIIPTLIEGLQHYVEVQLGMFTIGDSVEDGGEKATRLIFGYLKVVSLIVPAVLILKLSSHQWDKDQLFPLNTFEKKAIIYTALLLLTFLLFTFYFSAPLVEWLNKKLDLPSNLIPFMPLIILLMAMIIFRQPLLKGILRLAGIRVEGKLSAMSYIFELLYTTFLILLVTGPMYLHYQIDTWARGTNGWELFGWLAADSFLVGLMALLMGLSLRLAVTSVYARELETSPNVA